MIPYLHGGIAIFGSTMDWPFTPFTLITCSICLKRLIIVQEISQPYIRDKSEVYPLPSLFNRWNGSFQNKLIWEIIMYCWYWIYWGTILNRPIIFSLSTVNLINLCLLTVLKLSTRTQCHIRGK